MDYQDKLILAPMVRAGTLPFRLCALRHGADIVYGEEIIDKKIRLTERQINHELGTIEYVKNGKVIWSTCEEERGKNVFQIGTAGAVSALAGAEVICGDVAAVDVNMGCPKHFSVSGGMGAALLEKPETITDILTTLKRNLPVPVTAKIRLLPDINDTIQLLKTIESTGVSAIAVHARTRDMRKEVPARWDQIKILSSVPLSVPLIHNGDVFEPQDVAKCRKETGIASLMIARGALDNLGIFSQTLEPPLELATEFMKTCVDVQNIHQNTKYTLLQMLCKTHSRDPVTRRITAAKSNKALCEAMGLSEYYNNHNKPLRNGYI